jgi:hypothetical protein
MREGAHKRQHHPLGAAALRQVVVCERDPFDDA